jgi:hypothetical protein
MKRARLVQRIGMAVVVIAAALVGDASPSRADDAQEEHALSALKYTVGLDLDDARRELAGADAEDPRIAIEKARLAIYEGDCDGAVAILARPEVQKSEPGAQLADIARGCQRVVAATIVDRDDKAGIEVRWQDEHDRALGPLLFETIVKARDVLTRDLGVTWPRPTRVVIVRDLLSLSAMTGLPYKSAQTTGTVAVAKWGRVTLLSPRASRHGYPWRDTITHELTHLAVTRASRDRAPLWLQEGVAKREETRWRDPGPFDDRPSPDAIVQRGFELNLGLPLDKLGPSIAMLPSADAALVAFAEVTSFVRFYATTQGDDALPRLLHELREGKEPDGALTGASGADLKAWDGRWRTYLTMRPREQLPALFGLGNESPAEMRELRDRVRLAELLLESAHPGEAVQELDKLVGQGSPLAGMRQPAGPISPKAFEAMDDPSVRYVRARALEAAGRQKDAEPLVGGDPKEVLSSYGPWWAIRGRWARLRGDDASADGAFFEAVAADPLDIESACQTLDQAAPKASASGIVPAPKASASGIVLAPTAPASWVAAPTAVPTPSVSRPSLCDAARDRGESSLTDD